MKNFILFILAFIALQGKAQVTGVTVYTSSCNGSLNARQPFSMAPNGDIYMVDHNTWSLARFSGGTFTIIPANLFSSSVFADAGGVWIYNNNEFIYYNYSGFTDYGASLYSLIGATSSSNPLNYIGKQGNNYLIATNKGIVKFDGVNFSLIHKNNSNLPSDTVNCIVAAGGTTFIGTDKGLCTFNGNTFSPLIPMQGAPNQKVDYIFSNGVKTIVTRKESNPNSKFNFYSLSGNQLVRMPALHDSITFRSNLQKSMSFDVNGVIIKGNGAYAKRFTSAETYTTYYIPQSVVGFPVNHPSNPQKFYFVNMSPFIINEIDMNAYSTIALLPESSKCLDTNEVIASIGLTSMKHWDFVSNGGYVVPKDEGVNANFANSLWIGGLDNGGMLHLAGETYRQSGQDFWPGPLDTISGQTTITSGSPFNKLWKISCNQINQFVTNANAANWPANTSTVFADINSYIANGNNTNNFAKQLSPFYDSNNNGIYEPGIGEYPKIRGHQQIYSVYNDNYGPHTETGGLPLGVEVHERSFAYHFSVLPDSMKIINYTTFYNYEVINRSNNNYNNVYMSVWNDADLGYYLNDYVGTDTLNQFGYIYNGTNTDPGGYNNKLPMFAYALLQQISNENDGVDNNNNGQIDEPGERFRLNLTTFYNNNIGAYPPATTNPGTKWHYYNYMSGRWKDSSFFKPAGSAYNPTLNVAPAKYVFTGNPQTLSGWTEATAGLTPGDRRILCTIGPFNFPAKKKVQFEYAYVFSRDTSLNNVNNNFSLLQKDVRNIKHFMSQMEGSCSPTIAVGMKEQALSGASLWVYPNPAGSELIVNLDYNASNAQVKLYDVTGRVVAEEKIVNSYTVKMDLSRLAQGVYILKVRDGRMEATKKIVHN